jgi:nitroimidazol reductase NimA-like FMN-containing flavoprotein (pyridoxamine 5'-phosphate oxidase superfamily)
MDETLERAQETILDRATCLTLLATQQVGRLVSDGSTMRVRPVNFVVDDGTIYFRTGHQLVEGSRVVFEVDDLDTVERQGWSVIVDGHLVTAQPAAAAVAVLEHLAPWTPGDRPFLMSIVIDVVTGRWVRAERTREPLDGRGYL